MTLAQQHAIAKAKLGAAITKFGRQSRVANERARDLRDVTNRILRQQMKRRKAA